MTLYEELKQRNVVRVGIAYVVIGWFLAQVAEFAFENFGAPDWVLKSVVVVLMLGLPLALFFAWVYEITPEGVKKESEIDRSTSVAGEKGQMLNVIIAMSLVLAVALLLTDRFTGGPDEVQLTAADTAVSTQDVTNSIAVLPFVNMSSDEEQEFFSDGITEEILNSLASIKELNVAGRTSSFAFKGQNDDLRRIGDALGVNHILEGSVRKSGDQVRITAQLVQVDNGFHVWSETYDRKLVDIFAIQDEIANEILRQLKTRLLGDAAKPAEARRTDPVVYALYLKAKQRIYTRIGSEIETAVEELDQAIQLDTKYAPAFAQRGIATLLLSEEQYGDLPNLEANRRGKRFIDNALKIDPNHADAWSALGLYYGKDTATLEDSIDALAKALELNPNSIDASNWLQISLSEIGDLTGALEILEEMTNRDPLYRPAFSNAMQMFNSAGQPEKAEALLERMTAFDPDSPDIILARATHYLFSGRAGESLSLMEKRRDMGEMSGIANVYLSVGLTRTGQFERATEEGSPFLKVLPLYNVGRKDEAYELAYRFAGEGSTGDLFTLFIREGRDRDLTDFLEERWPSVAAFAEENRGSEFGYDTLSRVAFAYMRQGNDERFEDAMMRIDQHFENMQSQGVDNFAFSSSMALHNAMRGDIDSAFDNLSSAIDRGWTTLGEPTVVEPRLTLMADDPRFELARATMLMTLNRDREIVGLPPYGDYSQVIADVQ
jgi:TolB-like protein/tetratricopeptide (TPR) repeat protein